MSLNNRPKTLSEELTIARTAVSYAIFNRQTPTEIAQEYGWSEDYLPDLVRRVNRASRKKQISSTEAAALRKAWREVSGGHVPLPPVTRPGVTLSEADRQWQQRGPLPGDVPTNEEGEPLKTWLNRDPQTDRITGYGYCIPRPNGLPMSGIITRTQMEKICTDYPYMTLQGLSIEFPFLTRQELQRVLRAFGITKSQLFPQHILEEKEVDEVASFALDAKARSAQKRFAQESTSFIEAEWKKTVKQLSDLERNQDFYARVIEKAISNLPTRSVNHKPFTATGLVNQAPLSPTTTHVLFGDAHFGKIFKSNQMMHAGRGTSIAILQDRMLRMADEACVTAAALQSEEIMMQCLGDVLESLLPGGMHPGQELEMEAQGVDQFSAAMDGFLMMLERIVSNKPKTVNKITLHAIGGNHDRMAPNREEDKSRTATALFFYSLRQLAKRDFGDVVKIIYESEGIIRFATDKVGFISHHGDSNLKKRTTLELMNMFAGWSTKDVYTVIVNAHLHTPVVSEGPNYLSLQVPSLCSMDNYSQNQLGLGSQPGFILLHAADRFGVDYRRITVA